MLKVVHVKDVYLPISETFIYAYLKNMDAVESHVVAERLENAKHFPFERKHILAEQNGFVSVSNRLVHRVTRSPRTNFALLPRSPFAESVCREVGADVVHAHGGYDGFKYVSLKKRLGIPYVTTFYGRDAGAGLRDSYWRRAFSVLFKRGDAFLVEGSAMRGKLIAAGCPPEKIRLQRIGIDLDKFNPDSRKQGENRGKAIILMCGRMVEKKGFEYGVRAFSQIHSRFPNTEMRVIGGGPLFRRTKELVSSLGLDPSVKMLGYMSHDQYAEESRSADIFVQPSVIAEDGDSEGGAPTTLLEMQALGIPIVTTYHDDIPEVVGEGKSALLVKERDVDAMADSIGFLMENPDVREKMGEGGRENVRERHDILKLSRQLEETYAEICAKES